MANNRGSRSSKSSRVSFFADRLPHKVSEVVCLKCLGRWVAVRPVGTKLVDLECKSCGPGFVIETGEELKEV